MIKRLCMLVIVSFFIFSFSIGLAHGFLPGTRVVTPHGLVPIQELSVGDVVICKDTHHEFKQEKVVAVSRNLVHEYIQIQIGDEIIVTDADQRFYDYAHNEWVSAHNLVLFQSSISQESIIGLQPIQADIELYCLSVEHHHNFLITEYAVCVHNFENVASIASRQTARLAEGAAAYCGFRVSERRNWGHDPFALEELMQRQEQARMYAEYNKKAEEGKKNRDLRDGNKDKNSKKSEKESDKSKPIKVPNMKGFLEGTAFGKKIKGSLDKTKKIEQGQSVYKVKDGSLENSGLKEGDQIYLDGLHKDHLEVFKANGRAKLVLNLDGTINQKKTNSKEFQSRRIN